MAKKAASSSTKGKASTKKKPAPKKAKAQVKAKPKAAAPKKVVAAKSKGPAAKLNGKSSKAEVEKKNLKSKAATKEVVEEKDAASDDDEEFDPAAFFAASGGQGVFRAHIMRKERVDFNLPIRYRLPDSPLVANAELLNLSKGGLCLKTPKAVKTKTVLRIEIPLPHTSELFSVQAECIWSEAAAKGDSAMTGLRFMPMSLAKQSVIGTFIQQRRDELIMAKIGLDKFKDSAPVAGLD